MDVHRRNLYLLPVARFVLVARCSREWKFAWQTEKMSEFGNEAGPGSLVT